ISFTDLVVSLADSEGVELADDLAFQTGGTRIGYIPSGNMFVLRYDTTTLYDLMAKRDLVRSTPGVDFAAPAAGLAPSATGSATARQWPECWRPPPTAWASTG